MVSFWPWRGADNSPASFEKSLSTLSTKISAASSRLDVFRQRSRRIKALWTLYTSFAYILYSIILGLVVGWRNWGAIEFTAVAGGPVVIYVVRLALATYYEYRISRVESQVEELQKQRETTIEKLKTATKYNSTQQLLEKYGASPPQPRTPPSGPSRRKSGATPGSNSTPRGGRTGVPPPPTANIQRSPLSLPGTPQEKPLPRIPQNTGTPSPIIRRLPDALQPGEPEFAPNAFPAPPQYSAFRSGTEEPKWYDRIMDVLLGEDETLPKNRLALLCEHCKLVNGQAPPGVKRVADIGKWRCGGCGAWNGEEKDAKKLVAEIREQAEEIAGVGAVEDPDARIPRRSSFLEKSEPEDEDTIVLDVPHPEGVGETPSDIAATEKTSASSASEDESEGEPEPVPAPKPKRGRPKGGSNKRS